ncbi:MAG: hypothetical protein JJLCMIEE_02803 [Acidimicrobiales bacterium]|nr:hypothetical protein [Acidimicrobiales bacterium]
MSERLGHASPGFTLNVYQHVLPGMQAEAAEVFERLLDSHQESDRVAPTLAAVPTINVPDELARKLEAAAAARGTTVDALATALLEGHVLDDTPAARRPPRLVGIGSSDAGTSHQIDEFLAEGFGES